jgi:hypothetical protein
LISFLKAHPDLREDFENISKISASDLGKLDNKRKEVTFSDLELFDRLKSNFKLEKSVNLTQKSRCGEEPKIASTTWDQPATISLKLDPNSTEEIIPGSVLHYTSINIPASSKLVINNGKAALTYIKSDGDCVIDGTIESKNFRSGSGEFTETSPDGEIINVPLQEKNLGGRGGRGGDGGYKSCIGYPSPTGGAGASGTEQFGGGGGGSGYVTLVGVSTSSKKTRCQGYAGYPANGQKGGTSGAPSAYGGNGGLRSPMKNGGYLFLKCQGKITFSNSTNLNFSGTKGVPGEPGGTSCGGGGGGGPGGQGGYLFLNGTLGSSLKGKRDFSGGEGGDGGKKGSDHQNCGNGEDGKGGESGYSGSLLMAR